MTQAKQHCVERASESSPKLGILLITEDDPIYVIEFFKIFFAEFPRDEFECVGITIDRAFHESLFGTLRRLLGMYGYVGTLRQGLRFLGARLSGASIAALAASNGVKAIPASSVNDEDYIRRIRELRPDVIVSVACPEIFKPALLAVPRLGCVNMHSGRLPTYRGMMPTFWQMLRGEPAIIITAHRMATELDAGDVLATQSFAIAPKDSLDRVIRGTKREGARLLIRVLRDLRVGKERAVPLDMAEVDYFSFPKAPDVRAFRQRGHRLL